MIYDLSIPIATTLNVYGIKAGSEAEAIDICLTRLGFQLKVEFQREYDESGADDIEIGEEVHVGPIVQGNFFHGPSNDPEIIETYEDTPQ